MFSKILNITSGTINTLLGDTTENKKRTENYDNELEKYISSLEVGNQKITVDQTKLEKNINDQVELNRKTRSTSLSSLIPELKSEEPTVEFKNEEPTVEFKNEEPVVEFKNEEPTVEFKNEEPVEESKGEEPVEESKGEEPVEESKGEEPVVEPESGNEKPTVEPESGNEKPIVEPGPENEKPAPEPKPGNEKPLEPTIEDFPAPISLANRMKDLRIDYVDMINSIKILQEQFFAEQKKLLEEQLLCAKLLLDEQILNAKSLVDSEDSVIALGSKINSASLDKIEISTKIENTINTTNQSKAIRQPILPPPPPFNPFNSSFVMVKNPQISKKISDNSASQSQKNQIKMDQSTLEAQLSSLRKTSPSNQESTKDSKKETDINFPQLNSITIIERNNSQTSDVNSPVAPKPSQIKEIGSLAQKGGKFSVDGKPQGKERSITSDLF
jgi:hypothetical protein